MSISRVSALCLREIWLDSATSKILIGKNLVIFKNKIEEVLISIIFLGFRIHQVVKYHNHVNYILLTFALVRRYVMRFMLLVDVSSDEIFLYNIKGVSIIINSIIHVRDTLFISFHIGTYEYWTPQKIRGILNLIL